MKPKVETEKNLEIHLCNRAKAHGGNAIKISTPFYTGLPDRMVLLPGGRIFFVEVKCKGLKPTPHQLLKHRELKELGFEVYVVDGFASLDDLLPLPL